MASLGISPCGLLPILPGLEEAEALRGELRAPRPWQAEPVLEPGPLD